MRVWDLMEFVNEPAMKDLLAPKGRSQSVGPEAGMMNSEGISMLISKVKLDDMNSFRFLYSIGGKPVSVLQVIGSIGDETTGSIVNAYTLPEYRRLGYAQKLYQEAIKYFGKVVFKNADSPDGKALASAMGGINH